MLRRLRVVLAAIFFIATTLLFLDFTGTVHSWLGWMARVQFLPAVLALNLGVVVSLVVLTLVAGRVYCSVICPLGVFQDVISWMSGRRRKKRARFSYSPARGIVRYSVLALFVILMVAGFTAAASIIAPYSAYGRIASSLFAPIYVWGNNLLAYVAERVGSYAFYETEVWLKSVMTLAVAVGTLVVIVVIAWRSGRSYCNVICPVGTILGFISRYAMLRPVIDSQKCNGCSLCSRKCKASCVDHKKHEIDYSRCVVCMDCIESCRNGAIRYRYSWGRRPEAVKPDSPDNSARRSFLSLSAIIGTSFILDARRRHRRKVDGGLAVIQNKKIPMRETALVPAGALSVRHLSQHCTACQLCISVCPNQVLRPSGDIVRLMQPEMSYERGYCRPECTRCSDVCPTGAIKPVSAEEKSSIQIGRAVWVRANCVAVTDNVECGNCARHCPSGAILMVPSNPDNPDSRKIPAVNTERCIGCGACENLCPARPFSAIYVEGNQIHHHI